jgi:ABC-type sulfate transport system substrate-binding protein
MSKLAKSFQKASLILSLGVILGSGLGFSQAIAKDITLLNVSYDPTRELYRDYNRALKQKLHN